jgi:hypothetical protein
MRPLTAFGVGLAALSGLVDIYSGAVLPTSGMEPSTYSVAFYILGAVVIVTGLAMLAPSMQMKMSGFAALMETYGIVMVLASSYIPVMQAAASDAMFVLGALMIVDGGFMQYRKNRAMKKGA